MLAGASVAASAEQETAIPGPDRQLVTMGGSGWTEESCAACSHRESQVVLTTVASAVAVPAASSGGCRGRSLFAVMGRWRC